MEAKDSQSWGSELKTKLIGARNLETKLFKLFKKIGSLSNEDGSAKKKKALEKRIRAILTYFAVVPIC